MIVDFEKCSADRFTVDTVIVGGGAVGLTMLADRVRRGEDVLLLEAGGTAVEDRAQQIVRDASSSGRAHEGVHTGRFRLLGGTTAFWGGQLARFDPIVFESRAQLGELGWPIDSRDLDPHYDRALHLLGMDAGLPTDSEVAVRAKVPPVNLGGDVDLFYTRWVREPNLAHHFHADIASQFATVLLHAMVTGFAPHDGGHLLRIRSPNGRAGTVKARSIVLACGTLEIVRLLMLPYADGSTPPWHGNRWLGRAFFDHLDVIVGSVQPIDAKRFDALFENIFIGGYKYNPKLKLSDAAQRSRGLMQACGAFIFRTSYKENAENLRLFVRSLRRGKAPPNLLSLPRHLWALLRVAVPMVLRYLRANRTFHPKGSAIALRITTEQRPLIDSAVTLTNRTDAAGLPSLDLHWKVDGVEIETVAACAEAIRQALEGDGLAKVTLDPRIVVRDRALLDEGDDTNHQMGGARMALDPAGGVVDRNMKLFGASDIYVAGAATMPTSGFVNCTLTAMALGLRLNEYLRSQA